MRLPTTSPLCRVLCYLRQVRPQVATPLFENPSCEPNRISLPEVAPLCACVVAGKVGVALGSVTCYLVGPLGVGYREGASTEPIVQAAVPETTVSEIVTGSTVCAA